MTVLYHQDGREPKRFSILKKNADGTVDIGLEGAVVTNCKITQEPVFGSCTLSEPAKAQVALEVPQSTSVLPSVDEEKTVEPMTIRTRRR